jgi:serine protease
VERALRSGGGLAARRSRSAPTRFLVALEPGLTVAEAVDRFARLPEVEYAEPNGIVRRTQGATLKPDDRFYKYQWDFTQMNAERTWGIQKGKSSVAVAVLDSGAAYEDYTDPRTGQVFRKAPDWGDTKFLPGYDFVNGDSHPNDDEYHGTHVASTIAEATNNGLGMAGLAFGCAIMPVKVLDQDGEGTFFDVADGIDYATEYTEGGVKPVKVISMSLGSEGTSQAVKSAVDRAYSAGVLLVAAAGNSGRSVVEFPANLANVLAVGAIDARKERARYSNTGTDLDVVAPGGDCDRDDNADGVGDCIFQQMPDPDFLDVGRHDQFCYCGLDGTSMATPHVAAAAALLFSQGFTEPAAVRAALEQTAERLGGAPAGGRNDTFGHGLVQPAAALPGLGIDVGSKK